ncbi:uncharacterized protein si:dkey-238c7.16 [Triplophysa rosa]|uniref:Uncharacterized protein n=1 Tax=Triplophysa rosa TaxID=992332 RepID=A0A9W7WLT8_TRIRA|nr:uncharacterized protein si:dkey-238c7.16 [Triplophysa rosa]KAI7802443.1 hypothetical protein IRJ41_010274 [Triplophysa rosa]
MGAKLSRKKSEGGTGVEQNAAEEVNKTAEQKPENKVQENASDDTPTAQPDSSTSFLETITQAVEERVNTVTEQISAPVEDVVNKGIKAVESALAAVSLNAKEPAAPEQEPERIQASTPEPLASLSASGSAPLQSESTLLDVLLKSQPISESLIPECDSEVRVENETITSQMVEDIISNENKDLLERLDKVVTPSADLLDYKLTYESTIPDSDLADTLGGARQEACEAVDLI